MSTTFSKSDRDILAHDGRFVILLYHGVSRSVHSGIENRSRKHIHADEFQWQIQYLAKYYTVLSLTELLDQKRSESLPDRAVAITFDDGFENNYTVAFPILKHHNMPATFFLATGFIGVKRVFWVDKVEYLVNESPLSKLYLESLGQKYRLGSEHEKHLTVQVIKSQLKSTPNLVSDVINELEEVSQAVPDYDYDDYRTLTWDQVAEMHNSGLCEIGAHTVDHAILSNLSKQEKKYQILASRHRLEEELGEDINLFSYPEGQSSHFDEETVEILKAAGFSASPTAIFGVNTVTTSEYYLHRNMVGFSAPFNECLEVFDAHRS